MLKKMIIPKTKKELEIMREGGKRLARIKNELQKMVKPKVRPEEIEARAKELIKRAGGVPSFKKVKNYHWATCINVNEGVVHGVPRGEAFKKGDLVSVDVGMFYKGFHTDTSFTLACGKVGQDMHRFLQVGQKALKRAIAEAVPGNYIANISKAMQEVLEDAGFSPVRALTGHGIGRKLHEEPQIPCFWEGPIENSELTPEGATLAVEVIYTLGSPDLVISGEDNWTIATRDGKISGLFEETVAATVQGPLVLTA